MTGTETKWIGTYILDERGEPVPADTLTWGVWFETANDKRRVAWTTLKNCHISTVFLGLDHSFSPMNDPLTYKPVLWETMVFGGKYDKELRRYRSREAAEAGHAEMVRMCEEAERASAGNQ